MGVRNLKMHNKSLLFKWLWRYSKESDEIWQQVLDAIYGAKVGVETKSFTIEKPWRNLQED